MCRSRTLLIVQFVFPSLLVPVPSVCAVEATGASKAELTIAALYRRSEPAVVELVSLDERGRELRQGSGFFLSDGRIVTNYHVVFGAALVEIRNSRGESLGRRSAADVLDKEADLAILQGTGKPPAFLALSSREPEVGETVVAIGSPRGLSNSISSGIVSGIRESNGKRLLQISAPISPGSSGGPLLDLAGRVLGVVALQLSESQNINFAISAREVVRAQSARPQAFELAPNLGSVEGSDASMTEKKVESLYEGATVGHLGLEDRFRDQEMFIDRFGVFADQGESMFLVLRAARENVHLEVITKRDGVIVPLGSESTAAGRRLVAIQATFPSSGWHEVGVWSTSRNSFGNYLLSMQEGQVQSPAIDAERWLFVSRQEGSGVTTHLDLQGIRKINESAGSVWLRHDYDSPTRNTFPASPIDKELGLEEFDCRERTLRHRQVAYYLEGRQVDSVVFQTEPWKAVVPNSNGERWLKLGCELLSALN